MNEDHMFQKVENNIGKKSSMQEGVVYAPTIERGIISRAWMNIFW